MSETAKTTNPHEQAPDVEQFGELAHERREVMRNQLERAERQHKAKQETQNDVLHEATELAKEADRAHNKQDSASPATRRGAIHKKQLDSSFKSQMQKVQSEMTPTERLFSKAIHNKAVEKTTNVIGSTIARPNAMLTGSITAFIGVSVLYLLSKYYGFHLSGFETIATFILGWILGILYDYFSIMARGRKQ